MSVKQYKPFRDLLLVRKIEEKSIGSVILADGIGKRFAKLEVLEVGPDVKENIVSGDIVFVENMFEPINPLDKNIGLILSQYVMCKEINA